MPERPDAICHRRLRKEVPPDRFSPARECVPGELIPAAPGEDTICHRRAPGKDVCQTRSGRFDTILCLRGQACLTHKKTDKYLSVF